MKTIRLALVAALLLELALPWNASAQYNARQLTRKLPNQPPQPQTPNRRAVPPQAPRPAPVLPAAPAAAPTSAPPVAVRRALPVAPVVRPVDPEKARAARDEAERKAIEFQKKRAEEDYGWAQYALGVRYLEGNGVEKDPVQARKWLEKAAKNGEGQARKKLAELDSLKTEPDGAAEVETAPSAEKLSR